MTGSRARTCLRSGTVVQGDVVLVLQGCQGRSRVKTPGNKLDFRSESLLVPVECTLTLTPVTSTSLPLSLSLVPVRF